MNALTLPLVIPLFAALLGLAFPRGKKVQSAIGLISSLALLVASGWLFSCVTSGSIYTLPLGSWPAPFGIVLVLDFTAAIFLLTCSFTGFAVTLFGLLHRLGDPLERWYFPLQNLLILGVNGAFLTGDLFNLFVWFEVMLISSFVLMVIGGKRPQLEGGVKYVVMNLVASAFFLAGVGLIYGKTGTLNLADLAMIIRDGGSPAGFIKGGAALIFAAFGVKAGLFPLFFWLPASYHTPAPIVTALFAGLLTKVGIYSFLRVATLFIGEDIASWQNLFLWVAALTMITGVLGAAAQFEMRKILSFHIISQVGYLFAGLAMFTPFGLAAGLFYFVHNNLAKTNLLLVSAWIEHRRGTVDLAKIGGFYRASIGCSLIFLISAFALAGIPPLSGFWAKLGIVRAGLDGEFYWLTVAALAVGMMTLFSMTKIWAEAFWKKDPDAEKEGKVELSSEKSHRLSLAPMVMVVVGILCLSFFGEPVFVWSMEAARQLLDPSLYIDAVLGGGEPS
ncbi:MAG: proton-conducting transporter membrane subunit [Verrucomicrobiota bacterium]